MISHKRATNYIPTKYLIISLLSTFELTSLLSLRCILSNSVSLVLFISQNVYLFAVKRRSKSAHSRRPMPSTTTNRYGNDQQNELKINKNLSYNTNEYHRQRQQHLQLQQPQIQHHQVGPPQYHSIVNKPNTQSANYTNPM